MLLITTAHVMKERINMYYVQFIIDGKLFNQYRFPTRWKAIQHLLYHAYRMRIRKASRISNNSKQITQCKMKTKQSHFQFESETLSTTLSSLRKISTQISVVVTKHLMKILPVESKNLNPYCERLLQVHSTNKRKYVCVMKSADAYNFTHNEISNNIVKCKKISELRWNDSIIEPYL